MTWSGTVIGTKCTTTDGRSCGQLVQLERGHFATLLFMNVQEFIGTCPTHRRWSHGGEEARVLQWVLSRKGDRERAAMSLSYGWGEVKEYRNSDRDGHGSKGMGRRESGRV